MLAEQSLLDFLPFVSAQPQHVARSGMTSRFIVLNLTIITTILPQFNRAWPSQVKFRQCVAISKGNFYLLYRLLPYSIVHQSLSTLCFVFQSLGADEVVDYTQESVDQLFKHDPFDVVMDQIGGKQLSLCSLIVYEFLSNVIKPSIQLYPQGAQSVALLLLLPVNTVHPNQIGFVR